MDASMATQNEMNFQFLDLHDLTDNDKGQLLNLLKTDTKTLKLPWKKVMKKDIIATKVESQQHQGCNIMTYPLMNTQSNEWQYNVSNDQVPTFVPRMQYGHAGFNLGAQFQDVNYNQENGQCNTPNRDMRRGVQSGYLNEPMQVYPQMFMYYSYPPNHSVSTQQVSGGQIYYSAPIYSSLPQSHPNTQTVSSNSNACPTYLPSHNVEPINNYVQHELSQPSNSAITKPMPQIVPHNGCVENTSIPNKPVCHQVNSHNTSQVAIVNSSMSQLSVKNENTANIENVCIEKVNMKEQCNTACTVNNNCKRKPEVKVEKVNVPYVNTVSNSIKTEQNGELENKLEMNQNGEIDRNLNNKIVFGTPTTTIKISSESISKVDKDIVQSKENIASKDSQNKTVTISNGSSTTSNSSSSTSSTPSAVTPPAATVRSYASLFRKDSSQSVKTRKSVDQQNGSIRTPTQREESTSSNTSENQSNVFCTVNDCKSMQNETLNLLDDPNTFRMAEHLTSYKMDTQTVSLLPRGLTNRSSYCYINSILQALLACPPFYNLFNSLPVSKNKGKNSSTYLIDNMIKFVREFSPLTEAARMPRKDRKDQRREDIDIYSGVAFEPSYIYAILKHKSFNGVFSVEGRQEDAEEFLSCLLNGINDEMTEIMKFINGHTVATENNINGDHGHDEEEWQIMGPKNKGSITREIEFEKTPLSDIFRGQLRSRVSRAGEQPTDNVQPFFTLQLDVQKADSVRSAFEILVGKDQLEGMTSSKTRQQIEAWKQVTLEKLPAVLILHLKWFVYNNDNYANGCSKILKGMEFPVDLKIDNKFLSPNTAKKLGPRQKQYKLFAVTYHDGRETTKGHYFTDVFHVGFGCWLRYDDSTVKTVPESSVLRPSSPRVPYLLYYRRADTIGSQTANTKAQ
ncbi:ubiquitin carboxyl-terminal hydrolase 10 isoform X2 [Pseudomyrmex gracilis]|uniref:ubiquitin carboxyl-terminal hydrolase 10 isoform X2 n=1 Tax=Pseudomyrmex gracilis TaxID=219809 RepID=UPI000994B97A|nr:ubiquitin carboxyl-terminal hydrolase 10 isoform X2 [Pseudomyrmex gracilis]